MKAPPCPSSPAIARKRRAGSTTRSCARSSERLVYLRELEERRAAILTSIEEQNKLTPELRASIEAADSQAAARRSVSAVQAEAAHQGADRTRGRTRAAGRSAACRSHADAGNGSREVSQGRRSPASMATIPACRTSRLRSKARAQILIEQFAEDAELLGQPARASAGSGRRSSRTSSKARRRPARSSATTSPTANRSRTFRRIARSRCFAAARKRCCKVTLKLPEELANDGVAGSPGSMPAS